MYKNGQQCPICGAGKLESKVVEEIFEYKGERIIVPDYHIYECPVCEEALVDKESVKTSQKELKDFYRKVDGLLPSAEIKRIRIKLGHTQEAMAKELGVGLKNFARYENGQVVQGRTMDHLLRILDWDPLILTKIRHQQSRQVLTNNVVNFAEASFKYRQKKQPEETMEHTALG